MTPVKPLLIAACLALAGCASSEYSPFRQDAEDWDRANGECLSRAIAATPPQPMRAMMMKQVYDPCMQARGWKEDN